MELPGTNWNHLERAGTTWNETDSATNSYKKQEIIGIEIIEIKAYRI